MYTAIVADGFVVSIEDNDGLETMSAICNLRHGRPSYVLRFVVSSTEFFWFSDGYPLYFDHKKLKILREEIGAGF